MAHDLKARNIQIEAIQSVKPSTATHIPVDVRLRYSEGFNLDDEYDLVYKSYLENVIGSGFIYFTDSDVDGISCDKDTGVITLDDVANDFPVLSEKGIIRGSFDLLISGTWYANDVLPEITKDGDGNLLTATFALGNTDITTIRGRIY